MFIAYEHNVFSSCGGIICKSVNGFQKFLIGKRSIKVGYFLRIIHLSINHLSRIAMNRAVKYITEFIRIVTEMNVGANRDTVGGLMRIKYRTKYGEATLLLKLYRQSFHTLTIYPREVPVLCHRKVIERLTELNSLLDKGMTYIINDTNRLGFEAEYELTKTDPAYDAGLDGFCELLFKTVPSKLNDVVDNIIAPVYIHNDNTDL